MTFRRLLKWVLILLAIPVVLGLLGSTWVLYTEAGTRWSIDRLGKASGGAIAVENVVGTWASEVAFENFSYSDTSMQIHAHKVRVDVDLGKALARELHLELLQVDEIRYVDLSVSDAASSPLELDLVLPIDIAVMEARVNRFSLMRGDDVQQQIEAVRIGGDWRRDKIDLNAAFKVGGVAIDTRLTVAPLTPFMLVGDLNWEFVSPDAVVFAGHGMVTGNWQDFNIRHQLISPQRLLTIGDVLLGASPRVALTTTSDRLDYVADSVAVSVRELSLSVAGWLDNYRWTWHSRLEGAEYPPLEVFGRGSGDGVGLRVDALEAALSSGGKLTASGELGWMPDAHWQFDIALQDFNPAVIHLSWPGSLSGSVAFGGVRSDTEFTLDANHLRLAGELREQPIQITGRVMASDGVVHLDQLGIVSGRNRVVVDGRYGDRLALRYEVDINQLSVLGAGWSGSVTGRGRLGGTLGEPEFEVDLTASELRALDYAVAHLRAVGEFAPGGDYSELRIEAEDVVATGLLFDRIRAHARGNLDDHEVDLSVEAVPVGLNAQLVGGWQATYWAGALETSVLQLESLGQWQQQASAQLTIAGHEVTAGLLCWQRDVARACLRGAASLSEFAIDGRVENISLAPVARWLAEGVVIEGTADADIALAGTPELPILTFSGQAQPVRVLYQDVAEEAPIETAIQEIRVTGSVDPQRFEVQLSVAAAAGSHAQVTGQLIDWRGEMPRIQANLKASLQETGFLSMLPLGVANWSGSMTADFAILGDLEAPTVNGRLVLDKASAEVPRAGIALQEIEIQLLPVDNRRVDFTARARSGDGRVVVEGNIRLDRDARWPIEGTVRGENFTAVRLPGAEIVISPTLAISGSADALRVTGKVAVPRAVIELRELPAQAVGISPDVVVHGVSSADAEDRQGIKLQADVELELGKEVHLNGYGLNTDLGGTLALSFLPGKAPQGRGVVQINSGRFAAYGQELEIDDGRLMFTGALDDPALDVEAVRKVADVSVGVRVRGSGLAPEATIFSNPAMSEADALSYLIVGRPLAEATNAEGKDLKNAVASFGLKRVVPITDQIGSALGLDELSLDTGNIDAGAIMAGKQVTSDLYVRYSYGLFNRIGALLLQYRLTSRVNLEARSSEDQSVDIIYTRTGK